ncbi:hypothetical protein L2E82_08922 [Cichorium intybus]|uniref:Uncharacterized protein n=1 Tax=Cichorium intybus TaxID=13427 RepID=A0ACB9G8B1_CICIN|nr:hypothetical protein L2E82_08922 [Cichorium intybus]
MTASAVVPPRKVPVLYYLSQNSHLEHPHLMFERKRNSEHLLVVFQKELQKWIRMARRIGRRLDSTDQRPRLRSQRFGASPNTSVSKSATTTTGHHQHHRSLSALFLHSWLLSLSS